MSRPSSSAIPESKVARFLTAVIDASDKRQSDIAVDIGISPLNQNFISMLKTGKTKLPIAKVGLLAKSLGIDPKHLLRITLQEYWPEVFKELEASFNVPVLSRAEREMIELIREEGKVSNPRLRTQAERKAFLAVVDKLASDN